MSTRLIAICSVSRSDLQTVAFDVANAKAVPQLADHFRVDRKGFFHMMILEAFDSSRVRVGDRGL